MKNFFITGTDTNVGKTLVSAILTFALKGCYWKPIQSGTQDQIADPVYVKALTQLSDAHFIPSTYSFKASLSPDQAAKLENQTIDMNHIVLPEVVSPLIVEGAGGVLVPLNQDRMMLDLMKKFNFPIVIVSRGTVGTINHTLLTIEMLRQHKLTIQGIIFSGELNIENQLYIEKYSNIKTLLHVPFFENINSSILISWIEMHREKIRESFL